jgi:hypothetical protein
MFLNETRRKVYIKIYVLYMTLVTGYGLDDRGIWIPVPVVASFSALHVVQAGSRNQPASYPMGTCAEVKNTWMYTFIPS